MVPPMRRVMEREMSIHGEIRGLTVAPMGAVLAGLILQAGSMIRKLALSFRRRQIIANMLQLDDHMLRDMGLSRSDVLDAACEPIWRDPSRVLVERAVERRAAGWQRARERA